MSGFDPAYRRCVGLALFNRDGLVFMGRRANKKLKEHVAAGFEWQMPQGGIDEGEEPHAAALRELFEETNVSSARLLATSQDWLSYDLPVDVSHNAWKGRFKGQTQKWFAFRFEGHDSEINVHTPGGGMHKAEFDDWAWRPLAETPGLIIPFKRGVYEAVVREFAPFAQST
jgi:putative (di)nucleoside polyphosphate hydrolase